MKPAMGVPRIRSSAAMGAEYRFSMWLGANHRGEKWQEQKA
jgi:hypothetical protein